MKRNHTLDALLMLFSLPLISSTVPMPETQEPLPASRAKPKNSAETISPKTKNKSIESLRQEELLLSEESMEALTFQEPWEMASTKRTKVCQLRSR